MEEADKLIGSGKKHLVMGKVPEAVNMFQEACGMLAKKYGDGADECGEALLCYGSALLDLARMENSVLGNALEGVPEEDDAEDEKLKDSNIESADNLDEKTRDELRAQVYDAMAEEEKKPEEPEKDDKKAEEPEKDGEPETSEKKTTEEPETDEKKNGEPETSEMTVETTEESAATATKTEGEDKEAASDQVEEMVTNEQEEKAEKAAEEKADKAAEDVKDEESTENPEGDEEEDEADGEDEAADDEGGDDAEGDAEGDATAEKDSDEEEVGNLQLAWEMLELAKIIYKRKEGKEDQLIAAQAHLKLGEVASESGNYSQALEDFQECLKLQLKHLEADSRLLAETHYQLGLTFGFNNQHSQAIEHLNSSVSVINSRLAKLQEVVDKANGADSAQDDQKEMEELKALLPEIQGRIQDAVEDQKTASTDAEAVKEALQDRAGCSSSAFPAPSEQNGTSATPKSPAESTDGVTASSDATAKTPVSDITHLVRKKRKPEDSPVKTAEFKKAKSESPNAQSPTNKDAAPIKTNGDTTSVQTNGDASPVKTNGDTTPVQTNGVEQKMEA